MTDKIEELVEKIMDICRTDIQEPYLRHDKWARDKIRKLLQQRKPIDRSIKALEQKEG